MTLSAVRRLARRVVLTPEPVSIAMDHQRDTITVAECYVCGDAILIRTTNGREIVCRAKDIQ